MQKNNLKHQQEREQQLEAIISEEQNDMSG
jgi:hypothetical protein